MNCHSCAKGFVVLLYYPVMAFSLKYQELVLQVFKSDEAHDSIRVL